MKNKNIDDEIRYAIRYRVIKVDSETYVLVPKNLVKGHEEVDGFRVGKTLYPYAERVESLTSSFVVDVASTLEELREMYSYYDDDELLLGTFFEDNRNRIVFGIIEDNNVDLVDINRSVLADKGCDAVFCMDRTYPAVVLNDPALKNLLGSEDLEEIKSKLKLYKNLVSSFHDANKGKKVTRLYMRDGKVETIDTERYIGPDEAEAFKKMVQIRDALAEENEQSVLHEREDITYNGLREYIKDRIIGHDAEVDILARKIYMNYTAEPGDYIESVLLVGPTGTGKTETVRAASEYLGIPSYEINVASLVPEGIVGPSPSSALLGLYEQAGKNLKKAQRGILFLDEFDKISEASMDMKKSVRDTLLTIMNGGNYLVSTQLGQFNFDTTYVTRIYAGVFSKLNEKIKGLGFNSVLELKELLGTNEDIRRQILDKKYFTEEEITRIGTILAYNDLSRDQKKQALISSNKSILVLKTKRFARQFGKKVIARDDYYDAIFDKLNEDRTGLRSVYNLVDTTLNGVESYLLEHEYDSDSAKRIILTKKTVYDPTDFLKRKR